MTTITKEQFNKMEPRNGGDLWNMYKLCSIAFKKFPEATSISFSVGTGLWVNIHYTTSSNEIKSGTIYEYEPMM